MEGVPTERRNGPPATGSIPDIRSKTRIMHKLAFRLSIAALWGELCVLASAAAAAMYAASDAHRFYHWDCDEHPPAFDELLYYLGAGSGFTSALTIALVLFASPVLAHLFVVGPNKHPLLTRRAARSFWLSLGGIALLTALFLWLLWHRPEDGPRLWAEYFLQPRHDKFYLWDSSWLRVLVWALPVGGLPLVLFRMRDQLIGLLVVLLGALTVPAPEVAARFMAFSYLCIAVPTSYSHFFFVTAICLPPFVLVTSAGYEVFWTWKAYRLRGAGT